MVLHLRANCSRRQPSKRSKIPETVFQISRISGVIIFTKFSAEVLQAFISAQAQNESLSSRSAVENKEVLQAFTDRQVEQFQLLHKDMQEIFDWLRKMSQSDIFALDVSIYLSDGDHHAQVEDAVDTVLAQAGLRIGTRDDPVEGSWFRRMKAVFATPAARESAWKH